MARELVVAAATSVEQCSSSADCRFVDPGFAIPCVDCLHILGGDRVKAAIAAKAPAIKQACAAFESAGCRIVPSGCPGTSLDGVECQQGKCVWPMP